MNAADFDTFAVLLRERSGLALTSDKIYLLETRLLPVAHKHGYADLGGLGQALRQSRNPVLTEEVVEAMTTNETLFFRDRKPFDALQQRLLPQLAERRKASRKIRIWSAACSTGQEPYSLAMLLAEATAYKDYQFEILATDISVTAIKKAESGEYNQFEVQRGLPASYMVKYFEKHGDNWRIRQDIREKVQFRPFNLLHDSASFGRFDVIFCRNVLIYFDTSTKAKVVDRLSARLAPDGYIALGCSESLLGVNSRFKPLEGLHGIYAGEGTGIAGSSGNTAMPSSSAFPPKTTLAPRTLSR
jgi:chemotaxis protein methyltransferase CheR